MPFDVALLLSSLSYAGPATAVVAADKAVSVMMVLQTTTPRLP